MKIKTPFKCTFCEYETSYELSLRRHVKLEHEKFIEFKCKTCDITTPSKRSLRLHLEFCDGSNSSPSSSRYGGDNSMMPSQVDTVKMYEEGNLKAISSQVDMDQSLLGGNEGNEGCDQSKGDNAAESYLNVLAENVIELVLQELISTIAH